jgi:hypothetical protein
MIFLCITIVDNIFFKRLQKKFKRRFPNVVPSGNPHFKRFYENVYSLSTNTFGAITVFLFELFIKIIARFYANCRR